MLHAEFAVIDIETTGLFPNAHDRIVEIAVVRANGAGAILDEYVTLVNPGRDLGATHIHGLQAADVLAAPRFEDVAGDVVDRLSERPVAAHNALFDAGFISAEIGRLGVEPPQLPFVCTLELSRRLDIPASSRRLSACCEAFGITHTGAHSALGDARATACLLSALIRFARCGSLAELGCPGHFLERGSFPSLGRSGLVRTRETAHVARLESENYLSRLVAKMPLSLTAGSPEQTTGATIAYLDLLDRVLDDRHITEQEADALVALASEWGIKPKDVRQAHTEYLHQLATVAVADGVLSSAEKEDLSTVTHWLGLDSSDLEEALARARGLQGDTERLWQARKGDVVGKSVCFTGQLRCTIGGEPISREAAEDLARCAGMVVSPSVTKRLDLLVTADPLSLSGKATKARAYGVHVVAENVFWQMLGVAVD